MNDNIKAIWNKAASSHEQVKELIKEAGFSSTFERDRLHRLVELTVRECARLADEPNSRPFGSYGEKIKNHFGLEK
jgi:hypothetical protein